MHRQAVLWTVCVALFTPSGACAAPHYAYSGYEGLAPSSGVSATITSSEANVAQGQVLAWVGVGSLDGGPRGASEWIQAGFISLPGMAPQFYYEVARPGSRPQMTVPGPVLAPGVSYRISVLEVRRSVWRVRLDGVFITPPIFLPASHLTWLPDVVVESYRPMPGDCNPFAFRFSSISFRSTYWHRPAKHVSVLRDKGAHIKRDRSEFRASGCF